MVSARSYQEQLDKKIDEDREMYGKKPFDRNDDSDDDVTPPTPETKIVTKSTTDPECGLFHKGEHEQQFAYVTGVACDKHNPDNQVLKYSTTNRDGYREYKSNPKICANCQHIHKCTHSKSCQKVVARHIWGPHMEAAEDYRYTPEYKAIYDLRKETMERVFGDAKEKHGMRCTQLRGLIKVKMQAALTFACMNLKRLANWKCRGALSSSLFCLFSLLFPSYCEKRLLAAA